MSARRISCIPGPTGQFDFTSIEHSTRDEMAHIPAEHLTCMQVLPRNNPELMAQGLPDTNYIPDPSDFKDVTPLIMNKPWCWPNGSVITVKFLESKSDRVLSKIREYATRWSGYGNIKFKFVDSGNAAIRISFVPKEGAWSDFGTGCLDEKDQTKATMNFGWFDDKTTDKEFERTTVHEFGHAIGAIHEQLSPDLKIHWKKQAVYDYYKKHDKWSTEDVDDNFNNFKPVKGSDFVYTPWDSKSIMHYAILKNWNEEGIEVGDNTTLSEQDKQFIAKMYPK